MEQLRLFYKVLKIRKIRYWPFVVYMAITNFFSLHLLNIDYHNSIDATFVNGRRHLLTIDTSRFLKVLNKRQ